MHFLGSGGSQRFSEITAGGGWVRTVWRDMTFDLRGRLGGGRPHAAAAGRLLTGAARVRPGTSARRRPSSARPLTVRLVLLPRYRASAAPLHQGWARVRAPRLAAASLAARVPCTVCFSHCSRHWWQFEVLVLREYQHRYVSRCQLHFLCHGSN